MAGYYSNLCAGFFGPDWFISGWIKAKFLKPTLPDSVLHTQGEVAGQRVEADERAGRRSSRG